VTGLAARRADLPVTVAALIDAYRSGELTPTDVMEATLARVAAHGDPAVWIGRIDADALREAASNSSPDALGGVPFAVKDNIDVAGVPTTAGCPAYSYEAATSATAVDHLVVAGAVVVGKTNLDQFATGLVGTRSPYGTPTNLFDPTVVPGGSSSGSAVAVSAGLVPFALGTDTAGSGRVPAALGNIIGFKPTLGLVSSVGVVPACRSLDCVSVFALTARDAAIVLDALDRPDGNDIYSRPVGLRRQRAVASPTDVTIGVPDESVLASCDPPLVEAYSRHVEELVSLGVEVRRIDLTPFLEAGALLYDGAWLAERHAAVGGFIEEHPDDVHPITRSIIMGAGRFTAADAFAAEYRRRELAIETATTWGDVDAIVVPSVPTIPTIDEVAADPIGVNARLGRFSTFVNLLDLCAVAVPGGMLRTGLPVGFTLVAPACSDRFLLALADDYQRLVDRPLGALHATIDGAGHRPGSPATSIPLAVVGAHLSGQPLNDQLVSRGARLAARTTTSANYRLVALAASTPPKPGLARVADGGARIEVEVWDVPADAFGSFVAAVPAPLAIGKLELADGTWVSGFVCEPVGLDGAEDITDFGGWRAYLAQRTGSDRWR
jgi:allophanate hydrolase